MTWLISAKSAVATEPPAELKKLASILVTRCLACHGPSKQEGGYRVDTLALLKKPGDSGAQPIVAGHAEQSELVKRLTTDDVDLRMPAGADALPADQIATIRTWIDAGGKADDNLVSQPLTSWRVTVTRNAAPEHYPSALPVTAIAAHKVSDQRLDVWTSGYGEVIQWIVANNADAQLGQRLATGGKHISDIELSSDNSLLAVSSGEPGTRGFVEIFARREDRFQLAWTQVGRDIANDVAFSPDSRNLAVGQSDGTLLVATLPPSMYAVDDAIPEKGTDAISIRELAPHADAILAVDWSKSGDRLVTGSRDRTAKIFDSAQWQLIANYDRHERAVGGVTYIERYPVSLDETGKLRLWSGDDSDRTVAERDNQARFLERVASNGSQVWFAMAGNITSYEVQSKRVDDGKDADGKPKQKTTTKWSPVQELKSNRIAWILCLDVDDNIVVAGNELGEVVVWQVGQQEPWKSFVVRP